jgi:hypothetical protein
MALGVIPSNEFPDDDRPLEEKEGKDWNTQVAKTIWGMRGIQHSLFYNSRHEYETLIQFALGSQPQELYYPFLRLDPNKNNKAWTSAIDFQIKNYATKRVNIVVSKVSSRQYDVECSNIDPIAIDLKEDKITRLKIWIEQKAFFENLQKEIGIPTSPNGEEAQEDLPQNTQELDMFAQTDYKTIEEIGMELGVKHHLDRNKYDESRKEMAFDAYVLGVSAAYVGMDENIMPEVERVPPQDLIVPYNETPDLSRLPYVAQIIWMTIPEFIKKSDGYLTKQEIDDAIAKYAVNGYGKTINDGLNQYSSQPDNSVKIIPVLRYNYRSVDTIVKVRKTDEFGNPTLYDKPINYYARPKEIDKFVDKYGKARKLYRLHVNTVYEGYWVIGSDYIFRQGRRAFSQRKFGNLSEDLMGYKVFAPNSWRGKITSMGKQMIPVLNELQRYNLKIQQLVSRAIPKGFGVDLYALRKANLKWDNKDMSDQEKLDMLVQTGVFGFTSKDRYAPGSNYKPIIEHEGGMSADVVRYLELSRNALAELDEIIGMNRVVSGSNVSPEMGKAVAEQQMASSDIALDFLYNTDFKIFKEVVQSVATLHIKSIKYGNRNYYDRIFGRLNTGVTYSEIPFHLYDYGFIIKPKPTELDWQEIYTQAEKAYQQGLIQFSDILYLREIESIKQARRYLIMKENRYSKQKQEQSLQLQEANAQVQQQSAMVKTQGDLEIEKAKAEAALALEASKRETLRLQYALQQNMLVQVEKVKQGKNVPLLNPPSEEAPVHPVAPSMEEETLDAARGENVIQQLQMGMG